MHRFRFQTLTLLALVLFVKNLSAQDPKIFRRHYLILYDNSYPFYSQEEQSLGMLKTVTALFKNEIPEKNRIGEIVEGRTDNLRYEREKQVPFFDLEQDEISFYYFGLNRDRTGYLVNNRDQLKQNRALYAKFKELFIVPQSVSWSQAKSKYKNDVGRFLQAIWQNPKPAWGDGYTLSNLVYPVALERISGEPHAEEYILIVASDFLTGADFGNKQDYALIRQLFGYNDYYAGEILGKIDALRGKFYLIDYFDFEFSSKLYRDGRLVPLGIIAHKIRLNAGFYEPENVTIKIDSDLRLKQSGYRQPNYDVSETTINFLHNDSLKVSSLVLRIVGVGKERKRDTLVDTLLASYDVNENRLRCANGDRVDLDAARMNYTVPKLRARLKNFNAPDSLGFEALEVQYKFNCDYIIAPDSKLKITYTAGRTIPVEKVKFASKTSIIIMSYVLPILLGLGVLYLIIRCGRPLGIKLHFDGFNDHYEIIDYQQNRGRVRAPFKPWDSHQATMEIHGEVTYTFPNYLFNWGVPVFLQLTGAQCPNGFDIFLKDGENREYTQAYPIRYRRQKKFKATAVIAQNSSAPAVRQPTALEFKVSAGFTKGIFHKEFQRQWPYSFFIGPALNEVWVGLDPGTTGSCIASGVEAHHCVIQKDQDGQDLITPSIIVFDKRRDYLPPSINGAIDRGSYEHGFDAQKVAGTKDRVSFQSIKKMLGFSDRHEILFNNKIPLKLDGKELTSLLVEGLLADHKKFIESSTQLPQGFLNGGAYKPERLVVAIPNNFTSTKIQALVDSIDKLRWFKEVRYIHEAEAILLYYLHSKHRQNADENETVLIFDMGGATINATVVNVQQRKMAGDPEYHVDILAKLGYGIGGDTIDYCLIKLLYEFKEDYPELKRYNPFTPTLNMSINDREEQLRLRKAFMQAAFFLKTRLIDNCKNSDKDYLLSESEINNALEEFRKSFDSLAPQIKITINAGDPLYQVLQKNGKKYTLFRGDTLFKKLIYDNVEHAARDIIELANDAPIQTVIFSGRSVLFPMIKESVTKALQAAGQRPRNNVNFSGAELKSAVARGACIYGTIRNAVVLQSLKTNAYFGVRRTRGPNDVEFLPLVEIGKPFVENGEHRSVRAEKPLAGSFALDGNYLYFYQVMGRDHHRILANQERHKFSLLKKMRLDNRISHIGMEVFENDNVSCFVENNSRIVMEEKAFVSDQEIADAYDEHYTWIVH